MQIQTQNKAVPRTQGAVLAAFQQLLREREYADISVTDICRRADIVRKTFYNNFRSKDDVIRCLIQQNFQALEQLVDFDYMSVNQILHIALRYILDYRDELILFYKRGLLPFAGKGITGYIQSTRIIPKLDKHTTDERAYKYIAAQSSAVVVSVMETWIENNYDETPEFMAQITEDLMYKPAPR